MTHIDQLGKSSELDWQAFRYIAGEMTEPEAAAFESQMAEDQVTREAVVRAVELTETVSACHFDLEDQAVGHAVGLPRRGRRFGWWSAAVWASLGAAVALLLILGLQGFSKNDSSLADAFPSQSELPDDSTGELAEAWSETREPLILDGESTDGNLLETAVGADLAGDLAELDEDLLVLSDDGESELTAPEWMLAALEDLASDDSDDREELQTP